MDKFGIPKKTIELLNQIFSQFTNIEQVVIYGSRAMGNFKEGSDIDLTLKGNNIKIEDLLKIENLIDDLLLPYKVDLSIYNKIDNPDFIKHINHFGRIFN